MYVKYPFLPQSREILAIFSIDDIQLPREQILDQARYRILRAIQNPDLSIQRTRREYLPYTSYSRRTNDVATPESIVEFYSFFVAVLGSAKDVYVSTCLAKSEARRAKSFFSKERPNEMSSIMNESAGLILKPGLDSDARNIFECRVENYLKVASEYDLTEELRWSLVNLSLSRGMIFFKENDVRDIFASLVDLLMISGMRAVRAVPLPPFVREIAKEIEPLVPHPKARPLADYSYIERLIKTSITDGRHRTIWLILAPYFVNVKGFDESSAIDAITSCFPDTRYKRFIQYQVRRASRNGLRPVSENSLRKNHPDLFATLPKEIFTK